MNRTTTIATLCLMLGCAAGAAVRQVAVAPAGAQTESKKFQHSCHKLPWDEPLLEEELMPELGLQGWELVTFTSVENLGGGTHSRWACFKREVRGG